MNTDAQVRLRGIALPVQHGGWGFWLEPVLVGLLAAPSAAGVWLALAGLGAFLLHQPLRLAVKDLLRGRFYVRTRWAWRFAALYGAAALVCFALAAAHAQQAFWTALLLALPLAATQLWHEFQNEGREMLAEAAGALAFGALASAIALSSGAPLPLALAVWLALAVRAVPSIVYVRARLRAERGQAVSARPALTLHLVGMALLAVFAAAGLLPWGALLGGALLLARAWRGLSRFRQPASAKVIGFREIAYGLIYALLLGSSARILF